jgi:hypothetical protein
LVDIRIVPDPDDPTTQEERVIRALAARFDPNNQEELPDFSLDEETEEFTASTAIVLRHIKLGRRLA